MDELLAAAFEPVSRDLRAAGLEGELTEDGTGLRDGLRRAGLVVSGVKVGHVHVDPHDPDTGRRVQALADLVQGLVLEHVRNSGGRVVEWPPCLPSHVHPMSAAVLGGVAKWCCPLDSTIAVSIGAHP